MHFTGVSPRRRQENARRANFGGLGRSRESQVEGPAVPSPMGGDGKDPITSLTSALDDGHFCSPQENRFAIGSRRNLGSVDAFLPLLPTIRSNPRSSGRIRVCAVSRPAVAAVDLSIIAARSLPILCTRRWSARARRSGVTPIPKDLSPIACLSSTNGICIVSETPGGERNSLNSPDVRVLWWRYFSLPRPPAYGRCPQSHECERAVSRGISMPFPSFRALKCAGQL